MVTIAGGPEPFGGRARPFFAGLVAGDEAERVQADAGCGGGAEGEEVEAEEKLIGRALGAGGNGEAQVVLGWVRFGFEGRATGQGEGTEGVEPSGAGGGVDGDDFELDGIAEDVDVDEGDFEGGERLELDGAGEGLTGIEMEGGHVGGAELEVGRGAAEDGRLGGRGIVGVLIDEVDAGEGEVELGGLSETAREAIGVARRRDAEDLGGLGFWPEDDAEVDGGVRGRGCGIGAGGFGLVGSGFGEGGAIAGAGEQRLQREDGE